jgi:UDP-N-acetylglucosamine 2-epimerase (non-hydrolysing)
MRSNGSVSLSSFDVAIRPKIISVVGTRPNFMKTAPVIRELRRRPDDFEHVLVHTGQHYDDEMSQVFIDELAIGEPDYFLAAGSGSHAQQIARVIDRLEPVIAETKPDLMLVPGDVNSTLAAALAAKATAVPVGHIEAGLRSFDRSLPEETNRVIVDAISQLLFVHSPEARANLIAEGAAESTIHYVGNTMIDTLEALRERIEAIDAAGRFELERGTYLVVTLHRHWLFEDQELLSQAVSRLAEISDELPVVFPMHPRTHAAVDALGLGRGSSRLRLLPPLGYLEFLALVTASAGVLTDSGGIQEETTYLGIPCFTLRPNTERPITVERGTNTVLGLDPARILDVPELIRMRPRDAARIPLWDGNASRRIVDVLASAFEGTRSLETVRA